MSTEDGDLLQKAILKVKNKVSPLSSSNLGVFVPEDAYKSLFPMLEIWDSDTADSDIQAKAKFIYEFLGDRPRDGLLSIYTKLGACPSNERNIDRVYKFCRLQEQAQKAMTRYEQIQGDLREISHLR